MSSQLRIFAPQHIAAADLVMALVVRSQLLADTQDPATVPMEH